MGLRPARNGRLVLRKGRRWMRLTVAGETPVSAAICLPVWRRRRNPSMTMHVRGAFL
jgi:hypothetical protein